MTFNQLGFRVLAFIRACWKDLYPHQVFMRYLFYIYLSGFWLEEIITFFRKLQDDVFLLENT